MREIVDERDPRGAGEHGVDVELLECGAPVFDGVPRHGFEAVQEFGGVGPPVGLDEADHHIRAALQPPPGLFERGEGLPDPWGRAEVDPQLST